MSHTFRLLLVVLFCSLFEWAQCQESTAVDFQLMTASDLRALLSAGDSASMPLIVEAGWGSPEKYNQGHIPGAVYLDTNLIEADQKHQPRNWWNLLPVDELLPNLGHLGISRRSHVVVYGADPLAACRVCWTLMVCGVDRVAWLDGGEKAWTYIGGSLETRPNEPQPVDFGRSTFAHPEWLWSRQQVKDAENDPKVEIVDVRSREEYQENSTGYSYVDHKGKIPGAVWCGSGHGNSGVEDYLRPDGTLRPLNEIAQLWKERGISGDDQLVFYCGTGWRASLAFCLAKLMGDKDISVYDGGWYEWSTRP